MRSIRVVEATVEAFPGQEPQHRGGGGEDCYRRLKGIVDQLIGAHGGKSLVTVQEIHAGDGVEEVRERTIATLDPAGETVTLLKSANVRGLRVDRPDLETVFLALTGRSLRD